MELKIKHLSAKISDISINNMDISKRIKSEHLFTSIDECLEYLSYIVYNKRINPDNIFYISAEKSPVLYANIIDEAVCSIMADAFKFINRKDNDAIGYSRYKLDEFCDSIIKERDSLSENDSRRKVLDSLWTALRKISVTLTPIDKHKEELRYGELSLYYYNLMYTVYYYIYHNIKDGYFERLMDLYFKYLEKSYREYAPMGYCE